MLGNIFKIATLGIAGYGIKKLYEVYQNERERRANAPVYSPVEPIKMQEEEREQHDEEEPEDKIIDPMMQFIYDAKPTSYSDENFYQTLKRRLPKETKHWNDEQKNEFIQKMLSKIEGMDGWYFINAEHHFNIFELANAGSTVLDCFRFVADTFPNIEQSERVYKIIKQVEYVKERRRNPIYSIKMPEIGFKDVGFKLAVINQLMYKDNLLTPKFDMQEFANESKRLIDIDAGANWEVTRYFLNIDIPKDLLDNMQTLEIGEIELYKNIYFPTPTDMLIRQDYRGGCYVPITDNAVSDYHIWLNNRPKDLDLLPNLKEVIIRGNYNLIDDFGKLDSAVLMRKGNGFANQYEDPFEHLSQEDIGPETIYFTQSIQLPISRKFMDELKKRGIKITFEKK